MWVIDRAVLLSRSDDGRPLVFQGLMIDVTAQKEAERKAAQAEERFRELAESGPFVPYAFEVDHEQDPPTVEVTYVSPQTATILGLAPGVHSDQTSWLTAVHPHDRDRFSAQAAENLATGGSWDFDYRTIDVDGTVVWLNDRGSCIQRDDRGRPVRFVGALSNVTRSREELDAVETERARLRTLTERIPGVPWSGSFDTVSGRYRLLFVGPQIRELLGVEPATLLADGESLTRWIHPDDRAIVAAAQRAERSDVEYRVVRLDGMIRWVHGVSARATSPEENPQLWHGVILDVTERHLPSAASHAEHVRR